MAESILIKNGRFVVCNAFKTIENGSVYIEEDKIKDIGPSSKLDKYKADTIIDAKNKIVMPGLVDTHNHLCEAHMFTLFGFLKSPLMGIADALERVVWPAYVWLNEENTYHMERLGLLNSLKHGTTTVHDASMYPNAMGKAAVESGLRTILAPTLITSLKMPDADSPKDSLKKTEAGIKKWQGAENGRLSYRVHPSATYNCKPEFLQDCIALAKKHDVGLATHVAEAPDEVEKCNKKWPEGYIKHLEDVGMMGPKTIFFHSNILTDEDIAIYKRTDTKVAHNPVTNSILGNCARVPKLLAEGVTVGLGTDMPTNDIFGVMKLVGVIHNIMPRPARFVTPFQVFEMATIGGAKALNMEDQIGTLEVGKKADIITVDLNRNTRLFPLTPAVLSTFLVVNGTGADVDTVLVDGKVLMENRKPKLVDEEAILTKAQEITNDFVGYYLEAKEKGKELVEQIHPEY